MSAWNKDLPDKDNLDKDNDKDEDPTAQAASNDIALGKELVPFKQLDAKKKNHLLACENSSLLESINGISPVLVQVMFLRKFCV